MKQRKWLRACALGLVLALAAGAAAFAEDAPAAASTKPSMQKSQEMARGAGMRGNRQGMFGGCVCMNGLSTSGMTEEQKQALTAARDAHDAAEDAALDALVAEGALPVETVTAYKTQRNAERIIADKDYSAWTLDQLSALKQAISGGKVNDTLLAGFVSQGLMTQEESNLFALAYAGSADLWSQIDSSKATQGSMAKLQAACAAYQKALQDAGLSRGGMAGCGMMGGGMRNQGEMGQGAMGQGMRRNEDFGKGRKPGSNP